VSNQLSPRYRVVGVIHLPPLPGSARGGPAADLATILGRVRRDADAYAAGGANALMIENFGDVPFARGSVGPQVVAAMTRATVVAAEASGLPIGVNVLRNDVLSAVAIAAMAGGSFVRANVYAGVSITDQGMIQGDAEAVQALIRRLGAAVDVWADIDVKHAAPLAARPLRDLAEDAIERGLAAATIVSGRATGQPASIDDLRAVRAGAPGAAMYVGSGATAESAPTLLKHADGLIVGTAAKTDGIVTAPVDPDRVRHIVDAASGAPDRRE
jgi:membrane complex biogenesis BtpA family protein